MDVLWKLWAVRGEFKGKGLFYLGIIFIKFRLRFGHLCCHKSRLSIRKTVSFKFFDRSAVVSEAVVHRYSPKKLFWKIPHNSPDSLFDKDLSSKLHKYSSNKWHKSQTKFKFL